MSVDKLEIAAMAARLIAYTAHESGIAVLAHTDAASADLYVDGHQHIAVLKDLIIPGQSIVRLRARKAKYYLIFELVSPMPVELFIEMAELYNRLIQARLTPQEMLDLLAQAGV